MRYSKTFNDLATSTQFLILKNNKRSNLGSLGWFIKTKNMKTAMQELLSEMSHPNWDRLSFDAKYEMFDKLLDLEKEQIISAYKVGKVEAKIFLELNTTGQQYYNQTYN